MSLKTLLPFFKVCFNKDTYLSFIKTRLKPKRAKGDDYGYRLDFWEQCLLFVYQNMSDRYFTDYFDGKPPTIDSVIRDYIHIINEQYDKDYKMQTQNYIIALSANLKKEDLKSLKPKKPNYIDWDTEKWIDFLDKYQIHKLFA